MSSLLLSSPPFLIEAVTLEYALEASRLFVYGLDRGTDCPITCLLLTKVGAKEKQSHPNETNNNVPMTPVNIRKEKHLPSFAIPPLILVIMEQLFAVEKEFESKTDVTKSKSTTIFLINLRKMKTTSIVIISSTKTIRYRPQQSNCYPEIQHHSSFTERNEWLIELSLWSSRAYERVVLYQETKKEYYQFFKKCFSSIYCCPANDCPGTKQAIICIEYFCTSMALFPVAFSNLGDINRQAVKRKEFC